MIRSCMFCTEIKKDETGGACGTYGDGDSTLVLCWVNLQQTA